MTAAVRFRFYKVFVMIYNAFSEPSLMFGGHECVSALCPRLLVPGDPLVAVIIPLQYELSCHIVVRYLRDLHPSRVTLLHAPHKRRPDKHETPRPVYHYKMPYRERRQL